MPYEIYTKTGTNTTQLLPVVDPYFTFVAELWDNSFTFTATRRYTVFIYCDDDSCFLRFVHSDGAVSNIQIQSGTLHISFHSWITHYNLNGTEYFAWGGPNLASASIEYARAWTGANAAVIIYQMQKSVS